MKDSDLQQRVSVDILVSACGNAELHCNRKLIDIVEDAIANAVKKKTGEIKKLIVASGLYENCYHGEYGNAVEKGIVTHIDFMIPFDYTDLWNNGKSDYKLSVPDTTEWDEILEDLTLQAVSSELDIKQNMLNVYTIGDETDGYGTLKTRINNNMMNMLKVAV